MKFKRKLCIKFLICLSVLYLIFIYLIYKMSDLSETEDFLIKAPSSTSKNKLICLWTLWNHKDDWNVPYIKEQDFLERIKCPEARCTFVLPSQKENYPVTEYDAIVFNGFDLRKGDEIPSERLSNQIYVYVSMEPAVLWWLHKVNLEVVYNYTITYREGSDSIWTYSYIKDKFTGANIAPSKHVKWRPFEGNFTNKRLLSIAKRKRKNIVAVVSHCPTLSRRENLIERLLDYTDVSVYGKCGDLECSLYRNPKCRPDLDRIYRFYASFENTICKEYATEKIYYALERDIIPLVYGGADYTKIVPPHSYININDFKNLLELVKYLDYLSENPEEYVKYFWWRKYYEVERFNDKFCSLCENLHKPGIQKRTKIYKSIQKWWFENMCKILEKEEYKHGTDSFT